jgi:hypothetical protein
MGAKEKRDSVTTARRNLASCISCAPFIRGNQNERDGKR